jgi:hypothetical protein
MHKAFGNVSKTIEKGITTHGIIRQKQRRRV